MKFAVVFDGLGTGGIERVGADYIRILKKMGHDITIYNLQPEKNEMEKVYPADCRIVRKCLPELILPDRYMLVVKRWRWGKYIYPFLYLGASIGMYLYRLTMWKREKYDVSIAFSGHFRDLTFVSANYIRSEKKVCWLHGALMEYMASSCTYGDLYRRIKNLCVLSEASQESALQQNQYLNGLNIQHIYNPIDLDKNCVNQMHVDELKQKYGGFILSVGRFEDDKDQDTILKAMKILRDSHSITNRIVFVGAGSRLERCKGLAQELGLGEQAVFVGSRNDVEDFYTAAKLFVHSSPAEGLPTVLLEAMKFGVPIVATRSMPGVEEILQGDKYGYQCQVGNPEDMAEKILEFLENPKKREQYIDAGMERVKFFSYEAATEKMKQILDGLIS